MRILPVINQLKVQAALLDSRVEPAQSLTALTDAELNYELPIAFIYPGKETAAESDLIGATSQLSPKRFHVLIAAETSDGSDEPLEDVRDQVKTALIGWQPDSNHDPVNYIEGDVVEVSTRVIWWRDTFETWTILT